VFHIMQICDILISSCRNFFMLAHLTSVADQDRNADPPATRVFCPPGSGSTSQSYASG
jgi:hypothetical protein